jgi:hypothetical protein
METAENTAQGIVDAIRDMLGLDGDADVLGAVQQLREDERDAHACWREAERYRDLFVGGSRLIAIERSRQIRDEGWTISHDDTHRECELIAAALSYAWTAKQQIMGYPFSQPSMWPWDGSWWKPSTDPVRNLVKAGALIVAEIERLQRKR